MNCTQKCCKCQEEKPATNEFFYKNSYGRFGLHSCCKSCTKERLREWRKKNPEKTKKHNRDYGRIYRLENKEKIRDYWKSPQGKAVAQKKDFKRRSRKVARTQGLSFPNQYLIGRIYADCPAGYHVDHIRPIVLGGDHHESNLCYLPEAINLAKGKKTVDEFGLDVFNTHVIYWQDHLRTN